MNIYKHEFKSQSQIDPDLVGFHRCPDIRLYVHFPSFAAKAAMLSEMMTSFPKELLIAFGMTDMDCSTILGFFGLVFVFCQICLAIQAANYGFSLVSIEETEWTADFLLAKPVRAYADHDQQAAGGPDRADPDKFVVWISSFVDPGMFYGTGLSPSNPLVLLLLSMAVFQLFFLSVGMVISLLVKRVRNVMPILAWVWCSACIS